MNMTMNMNMNKNSKSKSKNMNSKNRNRKDKNNNTNSILKPTEAQLRYAQFHHKRRSQAVKHRIDRLHQTPLKVLITIGKVVGTAVQKPTNGDCDDGYCSSVATEETSDVEVKAIRLRRPKISAGRRAFLKDSKRSYRRRRKDIGQHGYRGYFIDDDDDDDGVDEAQQGEDTEGDFGSDTDDHEHYHEHDHEQREAGGDGNGDGHTADAAVLNEVFATLPKQHQIRRRERRKRRGKPSTGSRGESYRNFQAACHAMMRNIQTSQTKASLPSIKMADPSKRWRRSEAHVAAAEAHYKTFAGRRKASANKNAALLLSYKYYQQQKSQSKGNNNNNNNNNGFMDKGASWLTHLPAKQSKRSRRGDTYYFHDMNELPHLIQQAANNAKDHDNDDNYSADGNDSSSTLAMRKPGPQKFHRLMAYVQHKLIEKEKQNEQQTTQQHLLLLDGDQTRRSTGPGQSRTRQLAEIIEQPSTPQTITPSKIKQMADSIEGISSNATPTMKLKNQANTPFSGLTASPFSPTPGGSFRKRRGKSRYVPRMRLREFVVEGNDGDEEGGDSNGDGNGNGNGDVATPLPRKKLSERFLDDGEKGDEDIHDASLPPTPKMRLRDSMLGQESQTTQAGSASNVNMSTDRTKEMALAFEGEANDIDENSKFQQIRKSLEPDSTPKMKLKGEDRNHGTGEFTSSSSSLLPPAPKMRLRDSILGLESQATPGGSASNTDGRMSTERTREMALAFEGDETNDIEESNSKFQQIRKSLEPPKDGTPKMKLKGDFDRIDEPKAGDEDNNNNNASNVSRSSVDRLSKQFAQRSPQAEELMADFNRPSHDVVQEFSKHIDPRIYEQFEQMGLDVQQQTKKPRASSGSSSSNNRKSEGSGHDNDKRESTGSNVTEFFARIRGEQIQQRQQEIGQDQQQGSSNDSSSHSNRPLESLAYPPASPGGHSDAISDLSKGSTNVSGFWNRGRSSISNLTSKTLNTIAENNQTATHLKGKVGLLSPELLGRATNGLFNKFRGVPEDSVDVSSVPFPSTLEQQQQYQAQTYQPTITEAVSNLTQEQQQKEEEQQQQGQQQPDLMLPHPLVKTMSVDSHDALRNYHKTRASMSPEAMDSMSESIKQMNSGKPLPDQIREVVQNSGGTKKSLPSSSAATTMKEGANRDRSSVATQSTLSPSELSTEQYKRAHGRFLENSDLLGNEYMQENIIDTDDTQSIASDAHAGMDPQALARMMMSPDILQKRLKQAVGSVEKRKWEQVLFLINANPWLAEMKELTTNQYLLHKLAFFGTGTPPAPMSLSEQLVKKFPAAVHKFDQDGNVPLHLASAAGNVDMIKMLGEKFSSGASIRNEDGMLPLHFAIASFAIDFDGNNEDRNSSSQPLEAIKTVLKLFPQAVAIADNDGNLPLHVASECLRGGVGVDVVYLLMDEAERQLEDPYGARFRNKMKLEQMLEDEDEKSQDTMSRNAADDSSMMDTELHCTMVLNDFGETPLLAAIRSGKGWEMIEALVTGPGGRKAALEQDSDKNNALHLLVGEFQNATAAMSILKIVPETSFHRNAQGILPIEMACMVMMPEEVILAIALVDLPINIDDRDGIKLLKDRGESWYFLTCDCDDHMVHVVEEILSICSFQQLQQLCFLKEAGDSEETILDKATPKCREAMNRALRFLGRFEFVGDGPLFSDLQTGFKAFDALDFGGNEEGKPVLLECYQSESDFENRVYTMFDVDLESGFVEEVNVYVEHLEDENAASRNSNGDEEAQQQEQRCVAIERPRLTLNEVVQGMSKNGGYDSSNPEKRLKYSAKICSVLKLIGKALRHLHEAGVVHGNVCMETCGKFEDSSWKLRERLGVQFIGRPFDPARFLQSFPPESLNPLSADNDPQERDGDTVFDSDRPLVSFSNDIVAEVSIDIWAFGKICYESLVGKPLIDFDTNASESPSDDVVALLQTAEWNVSNMESVFADLLETGIDESGADMITACLFPSPSDRPVNMEEILDNPFWQEIRKHRSPRKGRNRKSGDSMSTSVSLLTDVDRYEV